MGIDLGIDKGGSTGGGTGGATGGAACCVSKSGAAPVYHTAISSGRLTRGITRWLDGRHGGIIRAEPVPQAACDNDGDDQEDGAAQEDEKGHKNHEIWANNLLDILNVLLHLLDVLLELCDPLARVRGGRVRGCMVTMEVRAWGV